MHETAGQAVKTGTARVLAVDWIPLNRAALCLTAECETIFPVHTGSCPACGGHTWVLLLGFLQGRAARFRSVPHLEGYGLGNGRH